MAMIDKLAFDREVEKANLLETVSICVREVDRIYRESSTIGGRKWAFSQLRRGYDPSHKAMVPPRLPSLTREQYAQDVASTGVRLVTQGVSIGAAKTMVVLALLRLDSVDATDYREQSKDAIVRDQDTARGRRGIVSVDRFVSIAEQMLDARSYLDRLLGIAALTGRRTFEVGCTASFAPCPKASHLLFQGQAKTRDRDDGDTAYPVPVIGSHPTKIVAALSTIREDRPDLVTLTSEQFHNRCAKDLHKRAQVFAPVFSDNTAKPKDLRSAYAEIAWIIIDERRSGKALYLSRILGHGDGDLLTAQSYDDFSVLDPEYQ